MGWLPLPVQNRMIVLLIAALTDLAIGDPQRLWHPVQGIGAVISASEKLLRAAFKVPEDAFKVPENVAKTPEGANPDKAEVLQTKTADKSGYLSVKDNGLEIKRDFVQPGVKKHAMYQWVVAANGTVNIDGEYVKFGHQDGNPSWPDGTKVIVSKNSKVLLDKDVHVKAGDGNDTKLKIDIDELSVKKGDILTFEIGARENNAWDGGRLQVKIKDSESKGPEIKPDTDNEANLFEDFGKQGHKGWYYGSCEWDSKNFELLKYDEKNECYKGKGKPELKKDFVEPDSGLNAA